MRRAEDAGPPLRTLSPRWAGQGDSHLSRVQAGGARGAGASGAPAAEGRREGWDGPQRPIPTDMVTWGAVGCGDFLRKPRNLD